MLLMYTRRMSWPFKMMVLAFTISWAAAPQVACFLPCGDTDMPSGDCCKEVIYPDAATVVKVQRDVAPHFEFVATIVSFELPSLALLNANNPIGQEIHPPPSDPSASSLVLRI